jgi:hypothetical protein
LENTRRLHSINYWKIPGVSISEIIGKYQASPFQKLLENTRCLHSRNYWKIPGVSIP